jgi:hypothetical protein
MNKLHKENQIRFKNLTHKAMTLLRDDGNHELASQLEEAIVPLHEDLAFWDEQTPSMLICASDNFIRMYHLPIDSEEYVSLDHQFHLAPLLGLFSDDKEFYLLELSEHNPNLLIGDVYGLRQSNIKLPANIHDLDESAIIENHMKALHNSAIGYPDRFFKAIDKVLISNTSEPLPLVLAGTTTETAAYKELSHYPKILSKSVTNSYDKSELNQLYMKVRPIIEAELIMPEHRRAINEYLRLQQSDSELTLTNEDDLMTAAEAGRVDKLLTNMTLNTTDNVQDDMRPSQRITFNEPRINSLLNKIASSVWLMKGMVFNLKPEEMPVTMPMVAKLRY